MSIAAYLVFAAAVQAAASLNVLAYIPMFGRSHVRFLARISDILIDAGHHVTVIAPIYDDSDLNEIPVGAEKFVIERAPATAQHLAQFHSVTTESFWREDQHPFSIFPLLHTLAHIYDGQCQAVLESGIRDKLAGRHFDIAYGEAFDDCGFALFYLLGIQKYVIAYSVFSIDGNSDFFGTSPVPSYVPSMIAAYDDKMTFLQRTQNAVAWCISTITTRLMTNIQDRTFVKYGIPPIRGILARASLIFTNSEPLVDYPRPTIHKIVEIGGISVASGHHKLNETWSSLLSLRNSTVLISFGSIALSHQMPYVYKLAIRDVVKSLPDVTFIWKYEKPEDFNGAELIENLHLSTWVPQNDLINDVRLTAFVTHAGAGSTIEVSAAGVPVVAIPIVGDQYRNAHMLKRAGSAITLHKSQLSSPESLRNALNEIRSNPSYKESARRIERMIRSQPFSPSEKLVKHLEFAAEFGPLSQLEHYGRAMWFWQYYLLDVIAFVCAVIVGIVTALYLFFRISIRSLCSRAKPKTE